MTGVEILNTEVVYITEYSPIPFWVCLIAGIIIGFLTIGFDGGWFDFGDAILGAFVGGLLGVLIGLMLMLFTFTATDEVKYIKHDVIISDEVNFNEFTEQYEIIEQNGKIYTVKERGN